MILIASSYDPLSYTVNVYSSSGEVKLFKSTSSSSNSDNTIFKITDYELGESFSVAVTDDGVIAVGIPTAENGNGVVLILNNESTEQKVFKGVDKIGLGVKLNFVGNRLLMSCASATALHGAAVTSSLDGIFIQNNIVFTTGYPSSSVGKPSFIVGGGGSTSSNTNKNVLCVVSGTTIVIDTTATAIFTNISNISIHENSTARLYSISKDNLDYMDAGFSTDMDGILFAVTQSDIQVWQGAAGTGFLQKYTSNGPIPVAVANFEKSTDTGDISVGHASISSVDGIIGVCFKNKAYKLEIEKPKDNVSSIKGEINIKLDIDSTYSHPSSSSYSEYEDVVIYTTIESSSPPHRPHLPKDQPSKKPYVIGLSVGISFLLICLIIGFALFFTKTHKGKSKKGSVFIKKS